MPAFRIVALGRDAAGLYTWVLVSGGQPSLASANGCRSNPTFG